MLVAIRRKNLQCTFWRLTVGEQGKETPRNNGFHEPESFAGFEQLTTD
jgi:hypothetical protein